MLGERSFSSLRPPHPVFIGGHDHNGFLTTLAPVSLNTSDRQHVLSVPDRISVRKAKGLLRGDRCGARDLSPPCRRGPTVVRRSLKNGSPCQDGGPRMRCDPRPEEKYTEQPCENDGEEAPEPEIGVFHDSAGRQISTGSGGRPGVFTVSGAHSVGVERTGSQALGPGLRPRAH